MASPDWIERELRKNFAKASRLGQRRAKMESRATTVSYIARSHALQIDLKNGARALIPVSLIPELKRVAASEIRAVEIWGGGSTLYWQRMDLDLRVPSLMALVFPGPASMAALARANHRHTAEAKAKAAKKSAGKGRRSTSGGRAKPTNGSPRR